MNEKERVMIANIAGVVAVRLEEDKGGGFVVLSNYLSKVRISHFSNVMY